MQEKNTYRAISEELKSMFPNVTEQSILSVRRYCETHDIHDSLMQNLIHS